MPENIRFLTCTFGELKGGKIVEKGTQCKMARGQMVRWMAEHKIEVPEDLRGFDQLAYCFHGELSAENHYVFLKSQNDPSEPRAAINMRKHREQNMIQGRE